MTRLFTFPLLLLAAIFLFPTITLSAQQLSKEEEKQYKDVAREYRRNLPGLKKLVEEHEEYQTEVLTLRQQLSDAQAQVTMKERQLAAAQDQTADLNQRVLSAEAAAQNSVPTSAPAGPIMTDEQMVNGTIFRVQIGAFEQKRMDSGMDTGDALGLSDEGSLQKVVVGQFRGYESAKQLRDRLRQMGVKGAFIVAYTDGQRVDVKQAMQATGSGE